MSVILKLLGAETEEQGAEFITQFTSFLADVRSATGTDGPTPALAAVKAQSGIVKQLEAKFGKSGDELVTFLGEQVALAATAGVVQGDLAKVLAAVGETSVDGALGSIATAVSARDDLLPKAAAKLAEQEKAVADAAVAAEQAESDALLATLTTENRISPSQATDLWPNLSIEGRKAFAKTAHPINGVPHTEPKVESAAGATTYNGKTYADMTGPERAEFKKADPVLFKSLRDAFNAQS